MEADRLMRLIGTISGLNTLVTPITERDTGRKSKMSSDLTMPDWKCPPRENTLKTSQCARLHGRHQVVEIKDALAYITAWE